MNIQAMDLVEIGAGGGSIASARLGAIAVAPESASSAPGPACYGRGGTRPTVSVPVPPGALGGGAMEHVRRAFDEAYAQRYGYASPGEAVEAVTWKLAAVGAGPELALPRTARRGALETARTARRPVYFPEQGGYADTPVHGRDLLSPGVELVGPSVTNLEAKGRTPWR